MSQSISTAKSFHWKNFSWQVINYGLSGILIIGLWIFLARMWPLQTFGQFSLVFAWASVYGLVIDLGLDFWVTKVASIDSQKAYSMTLVRFRVISAALIGVVFYLIGLYFGHESFHLALFLFGVFLLNIAHFFSCYLRAIERLSVEAILSMVKNITFVVLAAIGVMFDRQVTWVGGSYVASNVLYFILTYCALARTKFSCKAAAQPMKDILKQSLPIWISALLLGLSIKLDLILLGKLVDAEVVAQYSAAVRIFEGCLLLATAFVLTSFPALSRAAGGPKDAYRALVIKHGKLLILLSTGAAMLAGTIGGNLFTLLFGEQYQSSVMVFLILMLVLPISTLVIFLYNALIIGHKTRPVILVLLIGVLINFILDILLIPVMVIDGVLLSFIAKELFLLLGLSMLFFKESVK